MTVKLIRLLIKMTIYPSFDLLKLGTFLNLYTLFFTPKTHAATHNPLRQVRPHG